MTSTTFDSDEGPARPYMATAATVLLVLVILAAWQITTERDAAEAPQRGEPTRGQGAAVRQHSLPASPGVTGPPSPGSRKGSAAWVSGERAPETRTVYLVGSPEQAAQVQFGLNEASVLRSQMGEPDWSAVVLVVGSDHEAEIVRTLGASDAIRDALGLPPIALVDLRTP